MQTIDFESFGRVQHGRLVTTGVAFARNPYGSHNLVLLDEQGRAFRHGNIAVLCWLRAWCPRYYRKARRFLAERGALRDLVLIPDTEDPV
jgi:hypothetical protein